MHGNVWEWCADWFGEDYYTEKTVRDPRGPSRGTTRVLRGGSWTSEPYYLRSTNRHSMPPKTKFETIGLRVARTIKKQAPAAESR